MNPLQEYTRKRNFRVTSEPKAKVKKPAKTKLPIFVVQEHHASHLHYDFRLELDGVLKSWAVPKGPSTKPGEKRLAVEVEDHPLSYAKFHGDIPEGEYGAGHVEIWDNGTWQSKGDPHHGLETGRLEFTLKGKRLEGDWMLIRTRLTGKKAQWLLMKRSGHKAKTRMAGFIEPQLAYLASKPPRGKDRIHDQGLREDKPAEEVLVEKAKDREFTHPDKILFAEEELTKEDVAKYYETICKQILPFCKNRPLTIFRCPNGTSEECFIQRHPNQAQDFFLINSRADLRGIVQLSTIELHGWNCQLPDLEIPDQLVMDLDPGPGIKWAQVIQCALDIREYLDERGLKSFVKLSGGKGLHVHVPLGPTHTWDQVSSYAKNIAASLAQENALYISQSTKSRRSKKIYVDYLRNSRGTSAVLPYSLRAKETSSVAMPVAWSDLKKIKSAADFTLEKALKHIKTRAQDPWKGFWKLDQVLPAEEVKKRRRA